jgi:phage terminase large subunit-like protein
LRSAAEVAADYIDPPGDGWEPEPHQVPPPGNWFGWLLLGGRGAGKTEACAHEFNKHIMGPPCLPGVKGGHWPGIVAPTLGDAVTSCVNGPSGLKKFNPDIKLIQSVGGAIVRWPNGVEAKLFGAHNPEDVERLRSGGNRCVVWLEEIAAWRQLADAMQHIRYGLRVGPRPHWIGSTTPKNRITIKDLVAQATHPEFPNNPEIVMTRATTKDNPHLQAHIKRMLFRDYAHTRLGRQELNAEILEDVEGALWNELMIANSRISVAQSPNDYHRIVVGVDPPAGKTECGIIVMGRMNRWNIPDLLMPDHPQTFVLADYSIAGSPGKWSKQVLKAYREWGANLVVAEINNGGDMVKHTIHTASPTIPVKVVHATRGKAKRAEPVVGLYEQERQHHVGYFPVLEDQMTGWDADDPPEDWSPDHMDAMVWASWELAIGDSEIIQSKAKDTRLRGRR